MKKFFVLALVLVLTCASFTPAIARGGGYIQLFGVITVIDAETSTFTMKVVTPESYTGDIITVQVTSTTILKECDDGVSYRISFADLEKGLYVRVTGTFSGGVLIATKVIQYNEA